MITRTTTAAALAATLFAASGHAFLGDSGTWRREVQTDGAAMVVEVFPQWDGRRTLPFEVKLANTSDAAMLLPGGDTPVGLEFFLETPDGARLLDREPRRVEDLTLDAGESMTQRVELADRPLYFPSEGHLEWIVPVEGIYDPKLSDLPYLMLHVAFHGPTGESMKVEPIPVVLDQPVLLGRRVAFQRLHAAENAGVAPRIWDPTHPITPPAQDVPGRVLVSFAKEVPLALARGIVAHQGYEIATESLFEGPSRMLVVQVPEGQEADAIKRFRADPRVLRAERDGIATIM